MDKFVVVFAFLSSLAFVVPTGVANAEPFSTICGQTPYPELCNSLTISTKSTQTSLDETPFFVRDATLKFTLAQAQYIHNLISTTDTSSLNNLGKAAWADCLELYEDTIDNLARSTNPTTNPNDAQTWLSAAYANHETCKDGFIDFNLSHLLQSFPFFTSNFSKHLSNSLAINKLAISSSPATLVSGNDQVKNRRLLESHGFPAWVSFADRKLLQSSGPKANIIVAQDGSGNYKTISEALAASSKSGGSRFVIHVKSGVYKENVEVTRTMKNIMLVGDGIDATVVTGSKSAQGGATTFRSATFAVMGDGFIAQDMTFENTAGPAEHQAVALRSGSDLSVFYRCSFKGYQDTLYAYSKRQFYRDCDISGTVDFVFGDAVVVFQGCTFNIRRPMSNQRNTVTAQGRSDPNENTGIVIHNSRITGAGLGSIQSFLGRPWKQYSRTVVMRTVIDSVIDPAGWLPWAGNFALNTLYYAEYGNTGGGAGTGGRVKWGGYHVLTSPTEAGKFSVGNFLAGNSWIPSTGVPFQQGPSPHPGILQQKTQQSESEAHFGLLVSCLGSLEMSVFSADMIEKCPVSQKPNQTLNNRRKNRGSTLYRDCTKQKYSRGLIPTTKTR